MFEESQATTPTENALGWASTGPYHHPTASKTYAAHHAAALKMLEEIRLGLIEEKRVEDKRGVSWEVLCRTQDTLDALVGIKGKIGRKIGRKNEPEEISLELVDQVLALARSEVEKVDFLVAPESTLKRVRRIMSGLEAAEPMEVPTNMPDGTIGDVLSYDGIPFFKSADFPPESVVGPGGARFLKGSPTAAVRAGTWGRS